MKKLTCILILILLVFQASVISAQSLTLITIGDSLTAGVGDDDAYSETDGFTGYPGRLKDKLTSDGHSVVLHNIAVSGYDSLDVITSPQATETAQLDQAVSLINSATNNSSIPVTLVWIGSNNLWATYTWKCDTQSPVSCAEDDVNEYRDSLDTILSRLKSAGSMILVALQDDHSKRPVVSNAAYSQSRTEITTQELPLLSEQTSRYNTVVKDLAEKYGATIVDIYNTTIFEDLSTVSADDGDHPNSLGYEKITDIWYPAFTSALNNRNNLVNSDRLFDYAEQLLPDYFSPASQTYPIGDFLVRYYEKTNIYIGTFNNEVYVYGDIFNGLLNLGNIEQFVQIEK